MSRCSHVDGATQRGPARQRAKDGEQRSRSRVGYIFCNYRKPSSGTRQGHQRQQVRGQSCSQRASIFSFTSESVLNTTYLPILCAFSYRENIQKLSALHKDRPIAPLDLSVYWTEFVMRHKGAKHLRAAVHDLNWFQYFCLDVIALLATILLFFVIVTVKCMKLCFRKVSRKRKQE